MSRDTYWRTVEPNFIYGVNLGMVEGAAGLQQLSNLVPVPTAGLPVTVWDPATLYHPPASPVSLELVSSSVDDTAAGTGARLVMLTLIDNNYNESVQFIAPNGTTPVVLSGTYVGVNGMLVVSAGTFEGTNLGDLTLRVAGGGAMHGFILNGIGIARSTVTTVPAGRTLLITDIFISCGKPGGSTATADIRLSVLLFGGARFHGNTLTVPEGGQFFLPVSTGIKIPEKAVFDLRATGVSVSGVNLIMSYSGFLIDNANIPPG